MARKKSQKWWSDMNGQPFSVGARVELHPGMDLWMRGAKYGKVVRARGGKPCVRMDNKRVRRLVCTVPDRLKRV